MDNSNSSPRQNEIVESMFKSLNSYTNELQQELEILNRKVSDQIRIEQTYDKTQEQLQDDLIKLRASIDTNTVKRSILDRNLNERITMSQSLQNQINEKRQEQTLLTDKTNTVKYNHHRNIAKMTEQCASLTMAFRTNYHAYARADLEEIRKKTEQRLKLISDEVANMESTMDEKKSKLIELNDKLNDEINYFECFKQVLNSIANKLELDYDELNQTEQIEKQLENIQRSINELEAWHTRTNYPTENESN